jgi:hypothetical protein
MAVLSRLATTVLLWAAGATAPAVAQAPPAPQEYAVKAAYLLNFTRYVEWPADEFASADAPIVVGVLGRNPFGPVLEQTLAGRASQGRRIELRALESVTDAEDYHVVFIAREEYRLNPDLIERLDRAGLVTIGEGETFVQRGGVLSFVLVNQTIRFAVNLSAAERAGVRISSRMLALATAVYGHAGSTP